MKLYYAPGACSVGIHLLLEETGAPYEAHRLSMQAGETRTPAFLSINPKGKVPTLVRDDGSVLTEYGAIATWLARTYPAAQLLPGDIEGEVRVREMLDFCVGGIHKEGYTRIFKPDHFTPDAAQYDAVRAQGRGIVSKGLELVADALEEAPAGAAFSIADSALFYLELWSFHVGIPLNATLKSHFDRVAARPAAIRALQGEGLALPGR